MRALEKYASKRKLIEKLALVVSWGGRRKDYGKGKVQGTVGYSNLFGVVPFPAVGIRLGGRKGSGVTLTTAGLGFSTRAQSSFKDRPGLKGLSDVLLEKIEDRKALAAVEKLKQGGGKRKAAGVKLAKKLKEMTDRELLAESTEAGKSSKKRKRLSQGLLLGTPLAALVAAKFGSKAALALAAASGAGGIAAGVSSGKKKRRSGKAFGRYLSNKLSGNKLSSRPIELEITRVKVKPKKGPSRSYKGSKLNDWLAQQGK